MPPPRAPVRPRSSVFCLREEPLVPTGLISRLTAAATCMMGGSLDLGVILGYEWARAGTGSSGVV